MSHPEDTPRLVSDLLRDILRRLDAGNDRMGSMQEELSGLRFETARLKEEVRFANGRTGKLEAGLNALVLDELPALRGAMENRIDEVEGNVQAIQQTRAMDMAEAKGRAAVRAQDRARLGFVWHSVGKELWKYAAGGLAVSVGLAIGRVFGWFS